MNPWPKYLLVAALVSAPWNLCLLAGVAVVLRRERRQVAAGVAVAGLMLLFCISVLIMSGLYIWFRNTVLLPRGLNNDLYFAVCEAVGRYGGALGLGLVIAAAFLGRRVTAPRSLPRSSSATGPR